MFFQKAFFQDSFYNLSDIHISTTDLGLHRGYSIFDFFKLKDLKNPWIDWYMDRLMRSAKATELELPYSTIELYEISQQLLVNNSTTDGCVKIILSAGNSVDGYNRIGQPTLLMLAMPLNTPNQEYYKKGAKLLSAEYLRDMPKVKTTNYIKSAMMASKLARGDYIDVLYHKDGHISETSRCNFYIIKEDTIYTPDTHILEGITRRRVLSLEDKKIKIKQCEVLVSDLMLAEEAFITSSSKGVMPITAIDDITIGTGEVGQMTNYLMNKINLF